MAYFFAAHRVDGGARRMSREDVAGLFRYLSRGG